VAQSVRSNPRRSAFAAAFLSFVLPGLGHVYAGAYARACAFAAPAFGILGVLVAVFTHYGLRDFGLWVGQTSVLGPLIVVNLVILAYRAMATADAYRLVIGRNWGTHDSGRWDSIEETSPPPRLRVNPLSLAGLGLILSVTVAGHVVIGYWDLRLYNTLQTIYSPVVIDTSTSDQSAEPEPTVTFEPQQTIPPASTPKPWTGKGRLNILLVGVDQQDRGFRTDTMIVVSMDPATHQVAMFSMPRDTYGLPLQPRSRLAALYGSTYNARLNGLWKSADRYRQLFPGGGADALKQALGYAYGLDIQYYVLVNFAGFKKVVDTMGGVTVNVPAPVIDNGYPTGDGSGQHLRVYIPAGIQHMDGEQALTYARCRKGSPLYDDYNRSARQEQILVALQQQADLASVSTHLGDLLDALSQTVHTDMPQGPDFLGPLIDQARDVKLDDVKTYTFSPSVYGSGGMVNGSYVFWPNVTAIRVAVKNAISDSPKKSDELQAVIDEQAPIIVENGSGISGQSDSMAAYLNSLGLDATASTELPAQLGGPTRLLVVNGADAGFPATMALLIRTFGLTGPPSTDPSALVQAIADSQAPVQFIMVTGGSGASPGASPSASPTASSAPS
jgi:LCP family protein required for cell wall assembly